LPPAFAARLRAVLPAPDDDRLVLLDLRAPELERRVEEEDDDEQLDALRLRPPDPPAVDFRAPDELDLRAPEPLEDLRLLDPLELREVEPRELDVRELEPREPDDELELRPPDAREPDPDDFRAPDPPLDDDDLLRDDPPPLPELDSAISFPPLKLPCTPTRSCGRDYMPRAAVT
jgi:hypothetical protein